MEMFLMILCMSVFAIGVMSLAFGAANRPLPGEADAQTETRPVLQTQPARFFVDRATPPVTAYSRVPIEALLLQIERHVRLEQAAAESFLEYPTSALLHSKTTSPLVH